MKNRTEESKSLRKEKVREDKRIKRLVAFAVESAGIEYHSIAKNIGDLSKLLGIETCSFRKKDAITVLARALTLRGTVLPPNYQAPWERRTYPRVLSQKKKKWDARKYDSAAVLPDNFIEFYKTPEWRRLSYDVKKERGRRCECCGATPAHGVRIITDHVKPIRKYWHLRLERSNLQVLCDDCNLGKGSRDETDFRGVPDGVSPWVEAQLTAPDGVLQ